MDRQELINNLGTIASSGTAQFLKQLAAGSVDSSLIGQFGVGFYSAFLVASEVAVVSRRLITPRARPPLLDGRPTALADDATASPPSPSSSSSSSSSSSLWLPSPASGPLTWRAGPGGRFTVAEASAEECEGMEGSGTRVILKVKEDCDEYLEDYKLKELLRKYSEFVTFPIHVWSERVDYVRVPASPPSSSSPASSSSSPSPSSSSSSSSSLTASGSRRLRTVARRHSSWERLNVQQPVWRRPADSLTDEDYQNFYKTTFKAYDDSLGFLHFRVEGDVSFSALLFIPGKVPWELSRNMFDEASKGLRLYVKRVFINDKFTDALPRWLTFLRGVIDSEDLPLNVSREVLQKAKVVQVINRRIAAKAVELIESIKKEGGAKWENFWNNYGKYLKVGAVEDRDNQDRLAAVLEFSSSCVPAPSHTSLDDYVSRMPKEQPAIYYVSAETWAAAASTPVVERLRSLNYEVLYSLDPVEEFCLSALALARYKGIEIVDANRAELRLTNDEDKHKLDQEQTREQQTQLQPLCDWLESFLGRQLVHRVEVSPQLTSPAALTQGAFGLSPTLQRYVKQQQAAAAAGGAAGGGAGDTELEGLQIDQPVLLINPKHPIVVKLNQLVVADCESSAAQVLARQLFDVTALQGGYQIEAPADFAKGILNLITDSVVGRKDVIETATAPAA
eukprot:GHVT01042801.1.p1 GENE.GHVT01042801.1~~GHVT01042801.1.p1  ORF type:complete len:779 (-),score=252.72 GHVT01042801.1:739-2769(-)